MERKGLSESLRGYRKVLKLTKKPDRKEFIQTSKICALGIAVVAIIGFVIKLLSSLIQGTTF